MTDSALLAECEREPLHLTGAIQPFGALLAATADLVCSHVSANIAGFTGLEPDRWLNRPLPEPWADFCRRTAGSEAGAGSRVFDDRGKTEVNVLPAGDGGFILELMPVLPFYRSSPLPPVKSLKDLEELNRHDRQLVRTISEITHYARCLLYVFTDNGDGEVTAEYIEDRRYGRYLGLRFPASDIPQTARRLYLKNAWRWIADAAAEPCPLLSDGLPPPDLSRAVLRSAAPVHRIYLANMGVRSALSFPIVINNHLHGLVACHHPRPKPLGMAALRHAADYICRYTITLRGFQAFQKIRLVDGLNKRFGQLTALVEHYPALPLVWPEAAVWLMREFKADGAVMVAGDRVLGQGVTFEPEALARIDDWFTRTGQSFWIGDNLDRQLPDFPASVVAGALALDAPRMNARLYLCRKEHVYDVSWGGNPNKPVEYDDGHLGIAPRRSFEQWIETRRGYCRPWEGETRLLLLRLRQLLLRIF